jgi:hypothetical protein
MQARLSGAINLFNRILRIVTEGFTTVEKVRDIEEFFASHPVPQGSRAIAQACEAVLARAAWRTRDEVNVVQWFRC